MTDIIRHRGPDDEGFVAFAGSDSFPLSLVGDDTPAEIGGSGYGTLPVQPISTVQDMEATVALGHRRLSILDLSIQGHQPMCFEDGGTWITYNGEIYNYLELRTELTRKGYVFKSDTDTEVILAAYKEWGVHCLDRFIGMWAFAIYDPLKDEIFLARDRFGIKPLYYWFDPEVNFYFGSEIKQFSVCEGWRAQMNSQRVYDYLLYSLTDHTDETMFRGVHHLPSGHYYKERVCRIKPDPNGKIVPVRWYDLPDEPSDISFEEAGTGFKERFSEAVQIHLRSDVPVGSALSGGLDSSAIVCEINNILKLQGKNGIQKTFSSCSEFEKYDERKWMDIVVAHTGIDAHYIYPELEGLFELTPSILWHQDEPYQSQSAYLGYHVFQLAKEQQVKVLLNGQGADEYLGGYGQFNQTIYFDLLRKLKWGVLYREIQNTNGIGLRHAIPNIGYLLIPEEIRALFTKYFGGASAINKLINIKELDAEDIHPYRFIPSDIASVSGVTRLNLFHNPLARYLRWEDRNSMAHSIEARVPFLDHRLVEYTSNLPPDYLVANGVAKLVMRHGLKQVLPYEIANRMDKKGFITPEEHWVRNECPDLFRSKLEDAISLAGGILKPESLQYFDEVVKGDRPFDYTYIRFILFAEWIKIFKMEAP